MYEKSQITIAQILDAAQRSFVVNHYEDITMDAIAHEAKITKGAIYHHFKSKEDLFLQMMMRYLDSLQAVLQEAVDRSGSAYERLAYLTTLYLEQPREDQTVVQLVRRDANRFTDKTRERLITAYQNALPNQIEAIIVDGITNDEIMAGDPRLFAWHFVAIVEVYLNDYARQQFTHPQSMANHLTSLFFNGVRQQSV